MLTKNIKSLFKLILGSALVISLILGNPGSVNAQRGGGGGGGSFDSLACIFDSTVEQGQTATFFVSAGTSGGFSSTISVNMVSDLPGPYVSNSPMNLAPNGNPAYNYTGPAIVETAYAAPGFYTLTFTGTSGATNRSCTVYLTILSSLSVDLEFNNSDGPVSLDPSANGLGTLSWSTVSASSCQGSMSSGADTSYPETWTGSRLVSPYPDTQSFSVSGLQAEQSYTFQITCYDAYGNSVSDTVTVSVSGVVPDTSVTLYCKTPTGQDDAVCPVESGSSGILIWESTSATSCVMTDNQASTPNWPNGGYVNPLNEPDGQSTGNMTTNTTYTLTCSGPGGQSDSDTVLMDTYIMPTEPDAPTVSLDNSYCGYVKVTVTPGTVPPKFNRWYVGWGTTPENITYELGGETTPVYVEEDAGGNIIPLEWWHGSTPTPPPGVDPDHYSYNPEPEIDNYYKVAAINTLTSDPGPDDPQYDFSSWGIDAGSVDGPIGVDQCDLNLTNSDLDILSVDTLNNSNPTLDECTGSGPNDGHETIPGYRVFSVGQVVKYQVNVCNDGEYPFTDVSVENALQNLLLDPDSVEFSSGCAASVNPVVVTDDTHFTLNFQDVSAPAVGETMNACSATFQATIVAPTGASSQLYRFRNTAVLYVDGGSETMMSTDYSFRYGASIPQRGESN